MHTKEEILKSYFGYDRFRPLQAEIIDSVLQGKDVLVLMPTGGGKSLCYQVPALLSPGLTLVVSPLIALMKDQVQALKLNGIPAAFINSSLPAAEQQQIEREALEGKLKLLYLAPEKIFAQGYLSFLQRLQISLFAIDEAHCVSFWGHDFRPEYAQLHVLKEQFPGVPVMALTATADKLTRKDILQQLNLEKAEVFISSFDRPNLSLTTAPGKQRMKRILEFLKEHPGQPGIIYCLSRKSTEETAEKLLAAGFKAKHYHAGMDSDYRSKTQDAFLKDEIQIICATIAFGMGINKSNIRWVIHYHLPKNIESFYQEIGRAGRDGLPADTLLFYSFGDYLTQLDMLKELPEERKEVQQAKLERLKQYAEAQICRRRILLSYFNEETQQDCGNCDVCRHPRSLFDATVATQKALSAIARTEEQVGMTMLTDILRGSQNQSVLEKKYHLIKTFGAGREFSAIEWSDYLMQMLNSGYMDIAYDEGHALKLNNLSHQVLKGELKVALAKFEPYSTRVQKQEETLPLKSPKEQMRDELFEKLRVLRKQLADAQNMAAYLIFSDKTLMEMAEHKPLSEIDMLDINGVGHQKFNLYGEYFLQAIQEYVRGKTNEGKRIEGATYLLTLDLYRQGLSVDDMAKQRNLSAATIFSHLAKLYEEGHPVNLKAFITDSEIAEINTQAKQIGIKKGEALKPLFEMLQGKYEYHKLRMALAMIR